MNGFEPFKTPSFEFAYMNNPLESTATLLNRVRTGDVEAQERLCSVYLPILTNWAHGRLPKHVRDLNETSDMVQITLIKALEKLDTFKPIREGSFLAYLRKILLNNIRMEIRRYTRQSDKKKMINDVELIDTEASTIEQAIGKEMLEKYENALARLPQKSREAIILRNEFGFSFLEVAEAMDLTSANSARMTVSRALLKLAKLM